MDPSPRARGGHRAAAFLCGDDEDAKARVSLFVEAAGFASVDAGPLRCARFLEPTAQLMVAVVRGRRIAPGDVALGLLRR